MKLYREPGRDNFFFPLPSADRRDGNGSCSCRQCQDSGTDGRGTWDTLSFVVEDGRLFAVRVHYPDVTSDPRVSCEDAPADVAALVEGWIDQERARVA